MVRKKKMSRQYSGRKHPKKSNSKSSRSSKSRNTSSHHFSKSMVASRRKHFAVKHVPHTYSRPVSQSSFTSQNTFLPAPPHPQFATSASREQDLRRIELETSQILAKENQELRKIDHLQNELRSQAASHPLLTISFRDFIKGFVGAFLGIVIYYIINFGYVPIENITFAKAGWLYLLVYIIGFVFIYVLALKKTRNVHILMFIPLRLIILYVATLIMVIVMLFVFYPSFGTAFDDSFRMVAVVMLPAIIGAITADIMDKD